ncbi:pentapeptide repeat-containing protein [Microbispora hainanensis]|uniref:Pentapeptide repeat-containing protein n=1 Tax=Microbispora hainanensis TaxID=568844 RepID=A0A544Z0S9_9ACTN|nr:pentapeptide repeat-containing protein [Microbispora hainanensis]TQS22646.1 pentapeptide repeat-containing protein [Microbispora hainanensis]
MPWLSRRRPAELTPPPEFPRTPRAAAWWILPAVLLVGGTVAAAMWWLLTGLPAAPPGQAGGARGEALRTALAAGAGVGAAITLALSFRRQRHQEIITAHTTYDATERRVTELYTKAAEQLGHDKAAVRLAGLYALERLAQGNPGHRQTIVDVICAYLRMPYAPPRPPRPRPWAPSTPGPWQAAAPADLDPAEGERQVRLTAQTILAEHLRDPRRPDQRASLPSPPRHWPGMRIDLTGAILIDLDLTKAHLSEAQCAGATFSGDTTFHGAVFAGEANFDGAIFAGDASFSYAAFAGYGWFGRATFAGEADFEGATFALDAVFHGVTFSGNAQFSDATFTDNALFPEVTFAGDAEFEEAAFTEFARFDGATFSGDLVFDGATVTEFAGSRMNRAEWTQIADHPDHVWPPGWHAVTRPDGSTGLVRQKSGASEENGEDTDGAPSIRAEGQDGVEERPGE